MSEVALDTSVASAPPVRISKKKQLLFSFVIFVVFLALLEVALRILGIPTELKDLRYDPGLRRQGRGSYYTPGWSGYHAGAMVRINSAGWRGKEFSAEKPDGTIRIFGVGDSLTFGRAVNDDEVFLAKLEELLNAGKDGATYETINSGQEGINTVKELRLFEKRDVLKLEPDVVVLGFTVHNDAHSARNKNREVYRRLRRSATLPLKVVGSDRFGKVADTFRLAKALKLGVEWAYRRQLNEQHYNIILGNYADGSESWESCRAALEGFHELCREKKTPLLFVIFPVYPMEPTQTFKDYPDGLRKAHEKLKSVFSDKEGATVVDMLDDLEASGLTTRESMVMIDRHPNARWHEIVARRLYETIIGMGLKPAARDKAVARR
jgi:GDSL-like lipase/acylhydrolase family protein